jgi:hypothetical protein
VRTDQFTEFREWQRPSGKITLPLFDAGRDQCTAVLLCLDTLRDDGNSEVFGEGDQHLDDRRRCAHRDSVDEFIQTLTMVDVATGWTECLPLVAREGSLVVEAINRAQSLFPWLLRGVDFHNGSAFTNDVVAAWCREQKLEVTRSREYKQNDQAFVEQKNGAVVRRLMGYGRFDGVETARVMGRLYAAARLYVNFF